MVVIVQYNFDHYWVLSTMMTMRKKLYLHS